MFQRKRDILPVAGTIKKNPLAASPGVPSLPKAQTFTYVTYLWMAFSFGMLFMGIRFASNSTNVRQLTCDGEGCWLQVENWDRPAQNMKVRISRGNLLEAEIVRISNGKIRDVSKMRKKQTRKLGWSYAINYEIKGVKQDPVPMSVATLGRKRPRVSTEEINNYIENDHVAELIISESSGVDWRGVVCIIFSIFSLLFCALFGQFADPKPKPRRITRKR